MMNLLFINNIMLITSLMFSQLTTVLILALPLALWEQVICLILMTKSSTTVKRIGPWLVPDSESVRTTANGLEQNPNVTVKLVLYQEVHICGISAMMIIHVPINEKRLEYLCCCYPADFTYDTPEEASESFSTSLKANLELTQQHEQTGSITYCSLPLQECHGFNTLHETYLLFFQVSTGKKYNYIRVENLISILLSMYLTA